LKEGTETATGYRKIVIPSSDESYLELMLGSITEHDVFVVRQKCQTLTLALTIALQCMATKQNFDYCCKQAIILANMMGIPCTKNSRIIRNWYRDFRLHNRKIVIHFIKKASLPMFLTDYPDKAIELKDYITKNLDRMSGEMVCDYIHDTILPDIVMEEHQVTKTDSQYDEKLKITLNRIEIRRNEISLSTVFNLIEKLGFNYRTRQKSYYVDSHEYPEVQAFRKAFCKSYLAEEINMYRWVQLTQDEFNEIKGQGATGYDYLDDDGKQMIEMHVDCCPQDILSKKITTTYGGNLSIRKDPNTKPVVSFGQDEVIIKQYILPPKQWVGSNGERAISPKDEGYGIMYSCFCSREFGLFTELTPEHLERVNLQRENKKYADSTALKTLRGHDNKAKLTKSPFIRNLEYGVNQDGYWGYNNIVEQFEDCVDVIKTLYPELQTKWMFDQSSGHCKKKEGGLNVHGMNKEYGGSQKKLRDTLIQQADGYLGSFLSRTLTVGDIQHFTYDSRDSGPLHWSQNQRIEKKLTRK